ncbi:BA75_03046T0 [Komagataella pastoris]|uniref:Pre-rRNA-processing protein n=1 Tax=Komagataella pastoris TaxID=4922 RepID=A0A1B2JB28_PICPA|nr:BA75_03046T0 [Komagataella pastoris]
MAKKKTNKQRDFQKKKLKVGKSNNLPNNFTDTSFKAKSITLPNQTLVKSHDDKELAHYLAMARHHSPSTRKEILIHLDKHLPSDPAQYKEILKNVTPLIIDTSPSVREALVTLLDDIGLRHPTFIELHANSIVLFISSAMSHINTDIRNDSTKFLRVILKYGPGIIVRSSWVKILKNYCQLLNWHLEQAKKSLVLAVNSSSVIVNKKPKENHLQVLAEFLKLGTSGEKEAQSTLKFKAIHPLTAVYMFPATPEPFGQLNLYKKTELIVSHKENEEEIIRDLDSINCEDEHTRITVFIQHFKKPVTDGLKSLIKEGGNLGKEANTLLTAVESIV